ncbi:MAG TPA: plastocyanin/azurin family copper-binding protein [Candidatus Thermoplasmatota archaeon]|nr:plastocyanin/azurin family copper-binding protein [Candidatus Thermoplasmatota archaeon]
MRALAILLASLVAFGGLAGCVGNKDEPETKLEDGKTPGAVTGGTGGVGAQVSVLAPLATSLTLGAPAWVQSGTDAAVTMSAPANGKGALTYTWATGALMGTAAVTAVPADTGSKAPADYIQPGASKSITFTAAGIYNMHCHPHPFMRHNVTVIDGYAGPQNVEVLIADGGPQSEYRFVPENIVVGVGTKVTYKNVGQQPHSSTTLTPQSPPLKAAPLKAANGTLKLEGNGWINVVGVVQDGEGRLGIVNKSVYVTSTLPVFATQTLPFEFEYGASGVPEPVAPVGESAAIMLLYPAKITLNWSFADAAGGAGAPQNLAQIEIHFTKDGETQDAITATPDPEGTQDGKVVAGAYTLKVIPLQGVKITGTVVIDAVYELVPPAPTMPGAFDESKPHVH